MIYAVVVCLSLSLINGNGGNHTVGTPIRDLSKIVSSGSSHEEIRSPDATLWSKSVAPPVRILKVELRTQISR